MGAVGGFGFAIIANRKGYCVWSRTFFHPMILMRSAGEIVGTSAFVLALTLIPLSLASALLQANPLFVTLGAILFFRERVGWRRWLAIIVGLVGVLIILRPGAEGFAPEAIIGVIAALALAVRDLGSRHQPKNVHPLQTSTWGFLLLIPIGAAMLSISGGAVRINGAETALIAGAVALAMIGYHALTLAMQAGEIGFVTPFRYIRLVFGIALGWALFGEHPDGWMLIGAAIVVGAGLYTLIRERHLMARAPFQSAPAQSMTPPNEF
jgi:drug/metabolite transporter (DMT)-like permease